jgi:hypothetical protein
MQNPQKSGTFDYVTVSKTLKVKDLEVSGDNPASDLLKKVLAAITQVKNDSGDLSALLDALSALDPAA